MNRLQDPVMTELSHKEHLPLCLKDIQPSLNQQCYVIHIREGPFSYCHYYLVVKPKIKHHTV